MNTSFSSLTANPFGYVTVITAIGGSPRCSTDDVQRARRLMR